MGAPIVRLILCRGKDAADTRKWRPHPRVICADGFSMSVQAGEHLYCTPRINLLDGNYAAVEVGFPSAFEEALMPFAEDAGTPTGTVYRDVPVEIVEAVIAAHGGLYETKGETE